MFRDLSNHRITKQPFTGWRVEQAHSACRPQWLLRTIAIRRTALGECPATGSKRLASKCPYHHSDSVLYTLLLVLRSSPRLFLGGVLVRAGLVYATLVGILALLLIGTKSILNALLYFTAIVLVIALLLPHGLVRTRSGSSHEVQQQHEVSDDGNLQFITSNTLVLSASLCCRLQRGKPMHSWRVLILPFMERSATLRQVPSLMSRGTVRTTASCLENAPAGTFCPFGWEGA